MTYGAIDLAQLKWYIIVDAARDVIVCLRKCILDICSREKTNIANPEACIEDIREYRDIKITLIRIIILLAIILEVGLHTTAIVYAR